MYGLAEKEGRVRGILRLPLLLLGPAGLAVALSCEPVCVRGMEASAGLGPRGAGSVGGPRCECERGRRCVGWEPMGS